MKIDFILIVIDLIVLYLVFAHYYRVSYEVTDQNRYETFGRRFWAGVTDGIIFSPIDWIMKFFIAGELNIFSSSILLIISAFGFLIYNIILHGLFGQTFGKWLCKVKVVQHSSFKQINIVTASIRDGIPVALLTTNIAFFLTQSSNGITLFERTKHLLKNGDTGFNFIAWISIIWFICEIVTMLTNSKRRALHDYLAGTVVVRI